jgi:hypothetical protein
MKQYHSTKEILDDQDLTPFQRGGLIEQFNRDHPFPDSPPPLSEAHANELHALVGVIKAKVSDVAAFDLELRENQKLQEETRAKIPQLHTSRNLRDDTRLLQLVIERERLTIITDDLNGAPAKRAALVGAVWAAVSNLGRRLRELTSRTMPRYFENPNVPINSVGTQAEMEVARVLRGDMDETERLAEADLLRGGPPRNICA